MVGTSTTLVQVNGVLTAAGLTVTKSGSSITGAININSGARLEAANSSFGTINLNLHPGHHSAARV